MTAPIPIQRRHFLARALAAVAGAAWLGRPAAKVAEAAIQSDDPYVGEIRMFAGNFAPLGWKFCNGELLLIPDYETLFQLIGTTYGGDGQTTYALPDLRGRAPIHVGPTWPLAQMAGEETATILLSQLPAHNHPLVASSGIGDADGPAGRVPARNAAGAPHYGSGINASLAPDTLIPVGGASPHNNMQPYLGINFIISLYGVFPNPS